MLYRSPKPIETVIKFMFPFTLTIARRINEGDTIDKGQALARLADYIQQNKGKQITVSENMISFTVGIYVWSWDKFAQLEKGRFLLTDEIISFRAYMYRMLISVLFMSFFLTAVSGECIVGLLCFAWLSGGNVVTATIKYRRMVKDIADNFDRSTGEKVSANRMFHEIGALLQKLDDISLFIRETEVKLEYPGISLLHEHLLHKQLLRYTQSND